MNVAGAVEAAIGRLTEDFLAFPARYFTEEDTRWRLMSEIETHLAEVGGSDVAIAGGVTTSAVHGEYPTPFRCLMKGRSFEVLPPTDRRGGRGHFDVVVLNASSTAGSSLEVVRAQNFDAVLGMLRLPSPPLPFLDTVIEIKLYRDLAHRKRTKSIQEAADRAIQAVKKVAAALSPHPDYYSKAFARRGIVLLFDNSHLAAHADVQPVRTQFRQKLEDGLRQISLPRAFTGMWITSRIEDWPCPISPF